MIGTSGMDAQDRLDRLLQDLARMESTLNTVFGEREEVVRSCVLALLANEHVYLIGAPGTAKSLIIRTFAGFFEKMSHYETLLHGGSTISELVLPTHAGKSLLSCHIVFLDEVFRAPRDLLLGLLSFMNERVFHCPEPVSVPLLTLFGASNQSPSPADGLEAFYDRFTYRCILRPIESRERFFQMIFHAGAFPEKVEGWAEGGGAGPDFFPLIPELSRKRLFWGQETRDGLYELRRSLGNEGVFISDRRWKKVVLAATVNALYQGASSVLPTHLSGLKNVLWSYPTEIRPIERILSGYR
ncbi:MAG: AAA family ATPase [Leptospirillum sp.]|jgi:MoxR-like ATPase|nr:AAA family ATPase [Nitrospiraceae bacterium]